MRSFEITEQNVEVICSRSSGPGGQNVNKVNSKVQMKWDLQNPPLPYAVRQRLKQQNANCFNSLGQLVVSSEESRDQKRNKEICLQKIRKMVLQAFIRPKDRKATKPTKASVKKRLDQKKLRSQLKASRGNQRHRDD